MDELKPSSGWENRRKNQFDWAMKACWGFELNPNMHNLFNFKVKTFLWIHACAV